MRALVATLLPLLLLARVDLAYAKFSHKAFGKILKAHVKNGRVDYGAIQKRELAQLEAYIKSIAAAKPPKNKDARLTFYINAYNALVIKAVVDRWPGITSVMKVKGFFDKFRYRVAGKSVTLNQLENDIIRPQFNDPRIHFALVCAARSCPPLMSRSFCAERLQKDLERLTRRFTNSPQGVQIKGGAIFVSQLFNWYAQDFKKASGSVANFIAQYRKSDGDRLRKAGVKLDYLTYDWALNKR